MTSCLLVLIILFRPLISDGLLIVNKDQDMLTWLATPMAASGITPFICIFPTLPYAYSYLEEINCQYYKYVVSRCNHKKYKLNKIIFTALSGGASLLIPCMILFLIISLFGADTFEHFPYIYENMQWSPYLLIWGGRFVLLLKLINIFLFGCVWALIALLVSVIIPNRYIAFIVPFALYQAIWIITSNSKGLGILNPGALFRGDTFLGMPLLLPHLIHLTAIIIIFITTYHLMQWRFYIE